MIQDGIQDNKLYQTISNITGKVSIYYGRIYEFVL